LRTDGAEQGSPLPTRGDLWLMGGGGKTTLMYRLAHAAVGRGDRAVCTTTTHIWPPEPLQCPDLRVAEYDAAVADLRERPLPFVTIVRRIVDGKCQGFTADEAIGLRTAADLLLVEADGAAGRPLKAHAPHEPVIAPGASCVVAVVGGWCVGAPLDATHVHRPERFAALSGRALGAPVTAADVARVLLHDDGWLAAVPPGAAFHVVVTGIDPGIRQALARHPRAGRLAGLHGG